MNVIFKRTVVPIKYKSTANLKREDFPLCLACKLATTKATSADVITSKTINKKEGALSRDKYKPGDSISTDQFVLLRLRADSKVVMAAKHPTIVSMVEQYFKILLPI